MTRNQIRVRMHTVRARLNELASQDGELEEEQRSEMSDLQTELRDLDVRMAAIAAAEPEEEEVRTESREERERRELVERSSIGEVFRAAHLGAQTNGAIAELQAEIGVSTHSVPLELLMVEDRASASIPAAASQTPASTNQQRTVPAVFPSMTALMMGIDRVQVSVGLQTFPVLTAPESGPDQAAKAAQVGDTTTTTAAEALSPARVQQSVSYALEDASIYPQLDDVLRRNLRDAVASGLDKQALLLTGQGLLDFGTDPTASGDTETFSSYQSAALGRVDGRYANRIQDVRLLIGAATYGQAAGVYRGSQQVQSALEWMMEMMGGVYVSAYVPAEHSTNNTQEAVFYRGGEGMTAAIQPVWPAVEVMRDPYSLSREGEVRLTAVALANFRVIRAAQYKRYHFDLS